MKFDLAFPNNRLDSFDEGVEFGFRNLNVGKEWIPLFFYASRSLSIRDREISVGEITFGDSNFDLRGYNVSFLDTATFNNKVQLKLCGSGVIQDGAVLNFRWLQTIVGIAVENLDETFLDNVQVSILNFPQDSVLYMDNFNDQESIKYG